MEGVLHDSGRHVRPLSPRSDKEITIRVAMRNDIPNISRAPDETGLMNLSLGLRIEYHP
jgi:hypothetical protein